MDLHRHLDDELSSLRDRVLLLGGEAEQALERAMYSLTERDSEVARDVLDHDDQVDQLEVEIDRQCIDIIALRQPAARDLRFVISVAKMAPVLERIADHDLPSRQRAEWLLQSQPRSATERVTHQIYCEDGAFSGVTESAKRTRA